MRAKRLGTRGQRLDKTDGGRPRASPCGHIGTSFGLQPASDGHGRTSLALDAGWPSCRPFPLGVIRPDTLHRTIRRAFHEQSIGGQTGVFTPLTPSAGQETAIRRGLTLPQAISAFSRGEAAAIGATLDGRDVEIVQRWGDKPLLITDYQQDPPLALQRRAMRFGGSTWPSPRWASAIRAKAGQSSALAGASTSFNCAAGTKRGTCAGRRCASLKKRAAR